ncbi:hydroxymethylbilane synthase [Stella humosa]|uniref:Porphobilinogen deaminase n=2 Tax=Stella humosa TaxID=94 RepID=A0A3N1LIE0_9PROT|nr:hydroxymethylbilane synthase [Stella humosa]
MDGFSTPPWTLKPDGMSSLRIGTRGSPLALRQAHAVKAALAAADPSLAAPEAIEIVVIRTTGDRVQDRTLAEIGGKGLFTKEIEDGLLAGTLDLAVHSMKDVPTVLPDGLVIDGMLPRADPRDALVALSRGGLEKLPRGAVVGTASLRRQAQLLHLRPDLRVIPFRGNVDTRLAKLEAGNAVATLLALAGLIRLGKIAVATAVLEPETMLPAVAQGAIGIERRAGDERMALLLARISDPATLTAVAAERALLAMLDGSCRTPIAALAELEGDGEIRLRGMVATPDGVRLVSGTWTGPAADAVRIGSEAGDELRSRAPFLAT